MGSGVGSGAGSGRGDMRCRHKTVLAFGLVQVLGGLVVLGAGIYLLTQKSLVSRAYYHGVWGGCLLLLSGALGLFGGAQRARGCEIAFMVLSILLACGTWAGLVLLSLAGAVLDSFYTHRDVYDDWDAAAKAQCLQDANSFTGDYSGYLDGIATDYASPCKNGGAVSGNVAILVVAGALPLILILSASFTCCAVCRCCGARDDRVAPAPDHYGHY